MNAALVVLVVTSLLAEPPAGLETPRKPNPFAPSLRELTDEEEKQVDNVIDRFIAYDTGKLRGSDAKQALSDFQKLGPDAVPGLIRGLNRAAKIEHSCPAVTIAKKLSRMLSASRDVELLEFARENIGAGVTQSRHMGVIKDLRVSCMVRKNALAKSGETQGITSPGLQGLRSLTARSQQKEVPEKTIDALLDTLGGEGRMRAKRVIAELAKITGR